MYACSKKYVEMRATKTKKSTTTNRSQQNGTSSDYSFQTYESSPHFSPYVIQPKLKIGQPNDKHEQEADAMADKVMRMPDDTIQRAAEPKKEEEEKIQMKADNKPLKEEEEEKIQLKTAGKGKAPKEEEELLQTKPIMMKSEGGESHATPALATQLNSTKGSGKSLAPAVNASMSNAFGTDFSHVRVHTDIRATQMNQDLHAKAFTHGSDIYFNQGQYAPTSSQGKRLLAHELTHVVQQSSLHNSPASIQRYTEVNGRPYDRVSDDGKIAVDDHTKNAWLESSSIAKSNKVLKDTDSKVEIKELSSKLNVEHPRNPKSTAELKKIKIINAKTGREANLRDDCGSALQEVLGSDSVGYKEFVAVNKRKTTDEYTSSAVYDKDDNAPGGVLSTTEKISSEIYIRIMRREFGKVLNRSEALNEWAKLSKNKKKELSKKYGINEYANPKTGQGITIGSERDMPGAKPIGYNFHFAFSLAVSGHDYVALEDYASSGVDYYFKMYGPANKKQSFAQEPDNVGALGNKTTTMVVQHPKSLVGSINHDGVHLLSNPSYKKPKAKLAKGTTVKIIRKGKNWMKIEVMSGSDSGKQGWISNRYYTDT